MADFRDDATNGWARDAGFGGNGSDAARVVAGQSNKHLVCVSHLVLLFTVTLVLRFMSDRRVRQMHVLKLSTPAERSERREQAS